MGFFALLPLFTLFVTYDDLLTKGFGKLSEEIRFLHSSSDFNGRLGTCHLKSSEQLLFT
jgi:hypothetical protein